LSEDPDRSGASEETGSPPRGVIMGLARATLVVGRGLGRLLPAPIRRQVEDRVFFSVFQVTRVTNDAYGWRPEGEE
jgi:hypothetical protein